MHMSVTQLDTGRERPRDADLFEPDALDPADATEPSMFRQSLPAGDVRVAIGELVLRGAEGAD